MNNPKPSQYISNPEQKRVQEVFEYLSSGQLKRKSLNKITGITASPSMGYTQTKIDGYTIPVHRVVYIYHHGKIPDGYHIDHIDHDRTNNRIENLRAIPAKENLSNHMRSKHLGVYKTKDAKRWIATVRIELGVFDTEQEAVNSISSYKIQNNMRQNDENTVYPAGSN